MTERERKAYVKENTKEIANCAIGFLKSYPCSICVNELPKHTCWAGYKNKGACPVYKDLERRLSVVETIESEATDE